MRLHFVTGQKIFADLFGYYLSHVRPEIQFSYGSVNEPVLQCDVCILDMSDFGSPDIDYRQFISEKTVWKNLYLLYSNHRSETFQAEMKAQYAFSTNISALQLIRTIESLSQGASEEEVKKSLSIEEDEVSAHIKHIADTLTPREKDVLAFLKHGLSNKEIANHLGLELVTIKLHVRSICQKFGVKNRTQAALYAQKWEF